MSTSDRREFFRHIRQHSRDGIGGPNVGRGDRDNRSRSPQHGNHSHRVHALRSLVVQRRLALRINREVPPTSQLLHQDVVLRRIKVLRVQVPHSCPHVGPRDIQQSATWAEAFITRAEVELGANAIRDSAEMWDWVLTTTFSGAGFAEIAARSLQVATRRFISHRFGLSGMWPRIVTARACDIAPHARKVLTKIIGQNMCIFGDVMTWATNLADVDLHQPVAPKINFNGMARCHTHGRCALFTMRGSGAHTMHIEIAGPPCPPWSRMGRRRRHMDMRFAPHQVWIRWALEIQPHCIIFENVEAYDLQILVANFDAQTWSLQACVLDPRVFGMPLARPRLYCVITLRRSTVWNTTLPLHVLLEKFTAVRVMSADMFFQDPDPLALRMPTAGEMERMHQYEDLPAGHRMHRSPVWDLSQGGQRPRGSLVDGALPTFTTSSGSFWHRIRREFLSPNMLMRAMGHVSDRHCAHAADLDVVDLRAAGASAARSVSLAGNGMHVQCVGACLLVVVLHVRVVL